MADPAAVDVGLLVLRVLVGVTFSLHGFQKLFGWFGGGGLQGTAGWFRSLGFGDGRVAALMAGTSEVAGGLGLALGLLTPLAAAAMIGTMTTAAWVNHHENGFFSVKKGWEMNGYLIVVATALAIAGPGRWSLDHLYSANLAGIRNGVIAFVVGVTAGSLRWFTRERDAGSG